MSDVQRVPLEEADQRTLKKMNDDMIAVRQFVEQVQMQGEQRLSMLQGQMRETWSKIAEKYDLDLETVAYDLSNDGKELVPTTIRLKK